MRHGRRRRREPQPAAAACAGGGGAVAARRRRRRRRPQLACPRRRRRRCCHGRRSRFGQPRGRVLMTSPQDHQGLCSRGGCRSRQALDTTTTAAATRATGAAADHARRARRGGSPCRALAALAAAASRGLAQHRRGPTPGAACGRGLIIMLAAGRAREMSDEAVLSSSLSCCCWIRRRASRGRRPCAEGAGPPGSARRLHWARPDLGAHRILAAGSAADVGARPRLGGKGSGWW